MDTGSPSERGMPTNGGDGSRSTGSVKSMSMKRIMFGLVLGLLALGLGCLCLFLIDQPPGSGRQHGSQATDAEADGHKTVTTISGTMSCSETQVAQGKNALQRFYKIEKTMKAASKMLVADPEGFEQWDTPMGTFWIQADAMERSWLFKVLAEHSQEESDGPSSRIAEGDVVLDCGAHVGVFTRAALQRGARLVVSIELSPKSIICLRRNFESEIAAGSVIVYPKGVWNEETELLLHTGEGSAGDNLFGKDHSNETIAVPLTTIDRIVSELKLDRVDYIKMDIEGAEAEAIEGAQDTIRAFRPRLALAGYHKADDAVVLPRLIRNIIPEYWLQIPNCRELHWDTSLGVAPEVIYLQADCGK